jgi:hypothetical protein
MSETSATTNSSWVEIDITARAYARDLAHQFVEDAKSSSGIFNASILPFEAVPATGMTERIQLEIEPAAAATLLAIIMRLILPRRDKADSEVTVILRIPSEHFVEISGSLPDEEYLNKANEILKLISG